MVCIDTEFCRIRRSWNHSRPFGHNLPSIRPAIKLAISTKYHFSSYSCQRCWLRFIRKLDVEILADQAEFGHLLLEKLGMFFKMFQKTIACIALHPCNIDQYLSHTCPLASLMRSAHENNTVRGQFDGSLLLKLAFFYSIGMQESLLLHNPINPRDSSVIIDKVVDRHR